MRVFVAGGSGAIGRRLVPQLVVAGHQVTATTSQSGKSAMLRALRAKPVVLDALDRPPCSRQFSMRFPTWS